MSPEQADDARRVDHRADIYSLGITLLFLLTGTAFDGPSCYAVVLAHANKPLPRGEELGVKLPDNVETLIRRMAAKNPQDRYQTCAELSRTCNGSLGRGPRDSSVHDCGRDHRDGRSARSGAGGAPACFVSGTIGAECHAKEADRATEQFSVGTLSVGKRCDGRPHPDRAGGGSKP